MAGSPRSCAVSASTWRSSRKHNTARSAWCRQASRTPLEVRHALGIGDEESVIGTAGRLTAVKGQRYLIDAAPLILREEPNARFVFVGSGPLKLDLAARARALGIEGACLFVDP